MKIYEILAGDTFANAVRELNLDSAKCTYHYAPPESRYREDYQVWELSEEDYNRICSLTEESWHDNWGWWRFATGSNMDTASVPYQINGVRLLAWDRNRKFFKEDCKECSDFKSQSCNATESDIDECYHKREYSDFLEYCCDEIGASTERNLCALAVDLAQQNGMKMSELLQKTLG